MQCLNSSIQHVFSEGKNRGEYHGLPRDTVTFAWSLLPLSPLYDTYQDCAPTSVQDDGDVELAFRLRRLRNIKQQLAPWKGESGEGLRLPGKPSLSRRQLDKDMEQVIRIWGTTFKA